MYYSETFYVCGYWKREMQSILIMLSENNRVGRWSLQPWDSKAADSVCDVLVCPQLKEQGGRGLFNSSFRSFRENVWWWHFFLFLFLCFFKISIKKNDLLSNVIREPRAVHDGGSSHCSACKLSPAPAHDWTSSAESPTLAAPLSWYDGQNDWWHRNQETPQGVWWKGRLLLPRKYSRHVEDTHNAVS